ncbi:MAG: AEC family transporter [Alphaproteobacteria bacterium]|nr:AEC family transporter [Alphaproteobacteria bacterium]
MSTLISLTLPIFIVIGLGFFARKRAWIPESVVPGFNVYVFYFAMPALVISTIARQDPETLIQPAFFTAWFSTSLIMFGLSALILGLVFRERLDGMAIAGQTASVGNIGFLGLPLVLQAFGPEAAGPIAITLVSDLIFMLPLSILILEFSKGGGAGWAAAGMALRRAVLNPFLLSIVAGVSLAFSGLALPGPLELMLDFLAGAAGPTALFALGITLGGKRVEGDRAPMAVLTCLKLIVHPALAYFLMVSLGVTGLALQAGVVLAALPAAGNVFVIAEQYGVRVRRASAVVFLSTALAVVTMTVVIEAMG